MKTMFLKKERTVLTGSLTNNHAHMTAIKERNRINASWIVLISIKKEKDTINLTLGSRPDVV